MKNLSVKVSVCVPVCGTKDFLADCLAGIAGQDFDGIQIVVVEDENDGLEKKQNEKCVQKILKAFKKQCKGRAIELKFIKHGKNCGLTEARRTALYASDGEYVMFLDSDDTLPPGAIKALWNTAKEKNVQIVHGATEVCVNGSADIQLSYGRIEKIRKRAGLVFNGSLSGSQIFEEFLVKKSFCGFLWGKLFDRELLLKAYGKIPFVYCVLAEDFLASFFITFFARSYEGIEQKVYNYSVNTGISSSKKISSIEEWKKVCSTAGVFTIILSAVEEDDELKSEITEEQKECIKAECRFYAKNNLDQLRAMVVPELYSQAYEELCEWWGRKMIEGIENTEE